MNSLPIKSAVRWKKGRALLRIKRCQQTECANIDWSGVSISTTLSAPKGQFKKKKMFNQTAKINRAQIFLIAGCLIVIHLILEVTGYLPYTRLKSSPLITYEAE